MRKLVLALIIATSLLPQPAVAQGGDLAALRNYAKRAVTRCPDVVVSLKEVPGRGPANFIAYEITAKSADESCSSHKFLFYSPATQQILTGMVILLPQDNRPVSARLTEQASQLMKETVTSTVAPFPLPDGLKVATITKPTEYGPFNYEGWVDASERFLIIGLRGNLRTDPGASLLEALHANTAVRRGNAKAKVEIVELSDFECPTCARAHKVVEPLIRRNLAKVNFARLDFPLFEHHEWAMAAALGARAIQKVAPAKYWTYADYVFSNQEVIGKTAFDKILQGFCEDHDIPWTKVLPIYRSPTERQAMLDQTTRAFGAGLNSTPTFIINGQIVAYGVEGATMISAIKTALGEK